MNDYSLFVNLLEKAITEEDKEKLIWDILTHFSTNLSSFLSNPTNSLLKKLGLILTISPKLKQFLEESALLRKVLFECGGISIITVICREICFHAESFSAQIGAQIGQSAYAAAILDFPSSEFPLLLADLPNFLKVNLIEKYETLKEEASKAFAAAEEEKLKLRRAAFKAIFDKYWAEIPAEHLPALEKGRDLRTDLRTKWWNEPVSSSNTLTKEQLEHLKSYDEFTKFVISKMMEN
jgi:hypothetical protein